MVRNTRQLVAAMLGLALTAAISFQASAQDDLMPEDAMQQDTMQSEPVASVADEYGKGYGKGGCDDGCCCGSFYGEFQYLNLEIHSNEEDINPDIGSDSGVRLLAGYAGCDGLGIRARYFNYDNVEGDDDGNGLEAEYLDLELTDTVCICNLHATVSAGYRHARYDSFEDEDLDVEFDGDGVTWGVMVEREVSCSLSAYAWVQHSLVYGDDEESNHEEVYLSWTEVQLGVQYDTCVAGYDAFLRGGVEAHDMQGLQDDDSAQCGLLGWFLSAGVGF